MTTVQKSSARIAQLFSGQNRFISATSDITGYVYDKTLKFGHNFSISHVTTALDDKRDNNNMPRERRRCRSDVRESQQQRLVVFSSGKNTTIKQLSRFTARYITTIVPTLSN